MAGADRISELAEAVRYHRELYYNQAAPEVTDAEFDMLWEELILLDPSNAVLHEVGPEPAPGTVKVDHTFPMRSLDKGINAEDIIHFVTQSTFSGTRYIAQPKLDGSALSLEYVSGNLVRAATRGSGERGEDVTLNARLVGNVPLRLNIAADCHVRGEVVMPLAIFEEKYREISPNPRNLAAGALRQKHGDGKADARDLIFQAYDVKFPKTSPDTNLDSDLLSWLSKAGIEPAPWTIFDEDQPQNAMVEHTVSWTGKRAEYEYEIDGIVFKLDDLAQRERLGMTAHHPRWALAWKFPSQEAESVLLGVDWQTGRTGAITPVARIAPQMVGGVTVENVTLHNVGEVERLAITLGDKVRITRRGDVIPKIIENLGQATITDLENRFHANSEPFVGKLPSGVIPIPSNCPACDRALVMDGAFLRCISLDCDARTARSLTYWCRSLEMDGVGEKLIDALLEAGLVESIADLYRLQHAQLADLERMGDKSAYNVLDELSKTRNLTLARFLHALGMERIGPEVATTISQHFVSLGRILEWADGEDLEELTAVDGIGEKVAQTFRSGIQKRRDLIQELSTIIEITDEAPAATGILEGRSFCITGSLTKPRKEIALAIKNAGGRVVSSVSNSLDVLVAGDNAGSKLSKAQSLGLVVWSEEELFSEISNDSAIDIASKTLFDF